MKKILIMGMALLLVGCSQQTQAMIETTVSETATAAEQASREIEELTRLESDGQITYDEDSGDIINAEQEKQNQDMMNVIRQDVVDGVTTGDAVDEEVDMWCDFLSEEQKEEFKSELHLLDSPEQEVIVKETQSPKETKPATQPAQPVQPVQKPKETQPAPQPTQQPTQPAVTEPAPTPQPVPQPENNNTSGEIDTSGWNTGGVKVEIGTVEDQHLTDEQIEAINNAQWN